MIGRHLLKGKKAHTRERILQKHQTIWTINNIDCRYRLFFHYHVGSNSRDYDWRHRHNGAAFHAGFPRGDTVINFFAASALVCLAFFRQRKTIPTA